jgi:hypothetical protein
MSLPAGEQGKVRDWSFSGGRNQYPARDKLMTHVLRGACSSLLAEMNLGLRARVPNATSGGQRFNKMRGGF